MATLVRWDPFREMDALFDNAWSMPRVRWAGADACGPAMDVSEEDDKYLVKVSLPGVNPDDLQVTVVENVLTVAGEVKADEKTDRRYHVRERRFGSFSRKVTLPVPVQGDKVEAEYVHGVLTLTLPKAEEARPKRIAVKVSDPKLIEA